MAKVAADYEKTVLSKENKKKLIAHETFIYIYIIVFYFAF